MKPPKSCWAQAVSTGRLAGNGSWPPWKRLEFRILDRTLKLSLNPQFFLHLTTNTLKGLEQESSIDKELFIWYDGHWSHSPCSRDSTVVRNGQYIQIWWRACFSSSYQRRGPQGIFTELGIRDAHGQLPYSGSVGSETTPVSVRKSSSRTWNAQQVTAHLLRGRLPYCIHMRSGPLLSLSITLSIPSYRDWKECLEPEVLGVADFFLPQA